MTFDACLLEASSILSYHTTNPPTCPGSRSSPGSLSCLPPQAFGKPFCWGRPFLAFATSSYIGSLPPRGLLWAFNLKHGHSALQLSQQCVLKRYRCCSHRPTLFRPSHPEDRVLAMLWNCSGCSRHSVTIWPVCFILPPFCRMVFPRRLNKWQNILWSWNLLVIWLCQ